MTRRRDGFNIRRRRLLQATAATAAVFATGWAPTGQTEDKASMHRRAIPSTGEELPVIGLGTWQTFDYAADSPEADTRREVLKRFHENGGWVVDSSPMYGKAEALVGDLAADLDLTNRLFLATKVWTRGRDAGIAQIHQSARRFRRQVIDLVQVHNLVDVDTHLATLRQMKADGTVRYVGITHYTTSAYDDLMALMRSHADTLDFVQFNFNIATRDAERKLLPMAADRGVATLINEPFEKGSLFRTVRGKPLPDWAAEIDCDSWAQFFLKYIVSHPAVTCAIPATGDPRHAVDNTRAGYGRLPDAAMRKRMAEHFRTL